LVAMMKFVRMEYVSSFPVLLTCGPNLNGKLRVEDGRSFQQATTKNER